MKNPKLSHAFEVVLDIPDALQPLKKLASNFRWSWNHESRDLFRSIDKELWDSADHNPLALISGLSRERLQKLTADSMFMAKLKLCADEFDTYMSSPTWFDGAYPDRRANTTIAYFCAEFGITEGLPIYSGGLGVLAGDHLKAASDLGLPLVGVGLLYARGYFRQRLNHDNWQQEHYPKYDFYEMPLQLVQGDDDQPVRVEVEFPDRVVTCQIWRAEVGRVPLYLLDSNVLENAPTDQGITDTLYGGDEEMRIRQEMILGIGGMRALRAIGIAPTVCHMNEGHAAFLSIERIRQFMLDHNCDFRTARQVIVSGNVFTTHTPVPAGFDVFSADLLERYMGKTVASVGLSFQDFQKLGRIEPDNGGEAFNMAVLAMENSNYVNGVSKLHAEVTRGMFGARWPNYPEEEIPIQAITNGIHTLTWTSRAMRDLFDQYLDPSWRRDPGRPEAWSRVYDIPDEKLWTILENQRGDLVRFIRKRLFNSAEQQRMLKPEFGDVGNVLDPRILTIGFARRFATYKRATLLLSDKERLKSLLFHPERPIQIVVAGKSHPRDDGGKKLIQELVHFIRNEGARSRMVFVEDYDMRVARQMVQGVDLWLNNPRRPMEASGTSGMKVVPNGGLNCSILDGWWDEAFDPSLGFAIGERGQVPDHDQQDWLDSRSLYALIEHGIAPKFYHRVDNGLPTQWIAMIKRSIAEMAPAFSTARMVRDYATKFYMPSADAHLGMSDGDLSKAKSALLWRTRVQSAWPQVKIGKVVDTADRKNPVGKEFCVQASIRLGSLSPEEVSVEALIGKIGPNRELINTSAHPLDYKGENNGDHAYEGSIVCDVAGHQGYTVRVVPKHGDVLVASELNLVCWEGQ